MNRNYLLAFMISIGVIAAAFFFGMQKKVVPATLPEKIMEATALPVPSPVAVSLTFSATKDGQTALELLKESAQVEVKEYDFGVLVTAINGVTADDSHYWGLYINDEYATAGASQVVLKAGDTMKWVYEEISQAQM